MALYVDSTLKCRTVESLLVVTDGVLECIAVEIEMEKIRNVIVARTLEHQGQM